MKLKKRIISGVLTFAMMAGMVFGTSSLAMAQQHVEDAAPEDTITVARIDIEKVLTAKNGVLPSAQSFDWLFTPVSFQPASDTIGDIPAADMPRITGAVNTSPGRWTEDSGEASIDTMDIENQPGGYERWEQRITIKNTPYPTTDDKTFSGSAYIGFADNASIGVYTYKLQEMDNDPLPNIEYDQSTYYLNVYVVSQVDAEGKPTGNSTIASMTAWIEHNSSPDPDGNTADNGGASASSTTTDGKRAVTHDFTPDTNIPTTVSGMPGETQVMAMSYPFKNEMTLDPRDLTVQKEIIGNYSAALDQFYFEVSLTLPPLSDGTNAPETHDIEYYNAAGEEITIEGNPTTITNGERNAVQIVLMGGQSFTIKNIYGETYTVREIGQAGHNATYRGAAVATAGHSATIAAADTAKMFDNTIVQAYAATGNTAAVSTAVSKGFGSADWAFRDIPDDGFLRGADITVTGTMKTKVDVPETDGIAAKPAGTSENVKIVFTNEKTAVTPTGLVMTYWPYIAAVIAVLAVVGIFVGVNMKKKKSVNDISAGL